jgi:DNA replication protein DnaC
LRRLGVEALNGVLPASLPVSRLASTTSSSDLLAADRRVRECARCPATGGACAESERPGLEAYWDGESLAYRPCDRWSEYKLRRRLHAFGVPSDLEGSSFKTFTVDDEARFNVQQWLVQWSPSLRNRGQSVHLFGGVGVGKTHLACAALRALTAMARNARQPFDAVFAYMPKLLSEMRDLYDRPVDERRAFLGRVAQCNLLVLDDLGAQRTTPWVREQLDILVNERWSNARPVFVTSNLKLDDYQATLGERALSRLSAMCTTVCEFSTSVDQRRKA